MIGYDYTIISGIITFKDNVKTGALPGGLVRNPRTQHVRDMGAVSGKFNAVSIQCDQSLNCAICMFPVCTRAYVSNRCQS